MDFSPPGSSVHEFSRQGYWSGLPFPPPGDFPNPGIEPLALMSPALADGFVCLFLPLAPPVGRKVMTNLDSILKSRDITLPTRVRLVKAVAFPVVMYECESWTIKKAEHPRIDAFEV